jgi:hypothetical protein
VTLTRKDDQASLSMTPRADPAANAYANANANNNDDTNTDGSQARPEAVFEGATVDVVITPLGWADDKQVLKSSFVAGQYGTDPKKHRGIELMQLSG